MVQRRVRSESPKPAGSSGNAPKSRWIRYLSTRQSAWESALVAFPLFALYQIGILLSEVKNGADFVTEALIALSRAQLEVYFALMLGSILIYLGVLWYLGRRDSQLRSSALGTFGESMLYALSLGSVISVLMHQIGFFIPGTPVMAAAGPARSWFEIAVISAGAGVHEELIFRGLGLGGLGTLLSYTMDRRKAWGLALLVSSAAFSLAHHLGPMGEAFTMTAFVFRFFAGIAFGFIFMYRGAGIAIWTHALYDVYVLGFGNAG